ncbi:unnamed protein product [Clavelina lepadiformis]|uniref:Vesicle-fusing ATPase n=1 Tax=Clavelina lepadiformis TaxID=159417 RepID=A0ABP0FMU5_CLALP
MLRAVHIVNGPEILNKHVGESEENIRKLFEPAELEQEKSGLHIIIFDEIDAICKQRGSVAALEGMTNRRDMIDEALLRPGRLEVNLEIGLPDEYGRLQILSIHTQKMKDSQTLSDEGVLGKIASLTENFTGAELAGLVRAALSRALVRRKGQLQSRSDVEADHKILVSHQDFTESLENDTKLAFGFQRENLKYFMSHGIIEWNYRITRILKKSAVICDQVRSSNRTPLVSVLITGGVGSGKTALATKIADDSGFPFMRVCTPDNLIGFSEAAKCQYLKKGHRLLVIATSSNDDLLSKMEIEKSFDSHIKIPLLNAEAINTVLETDRVFPKTSKNAKSSSVLNPRYASLQLRNKNRKSVTRASLHFWRRKQG